MIITAYDPPAPSSLMGLSPPCLTPFSFQPKACAATRHAWHHPRSSQLMIGRCCQLLLPANCRLASQRSLKINVPPAQLALHRAVSCHLMVGAEAPLAAAGSRLCPSLQHGRSTGGIRSSPCQIHSYRVAWMLAHRAPHICSLDAWGRPCASACLTTLMMLMAPQLLPQRSLPAEP